MGSRNGVAFFKDFFPVMVMKLGVEGFMEELGKGFRLLMDKEKGLITFESLKKKTGLLGLGGMMEDDEIMCMLREGDLDGDGALSEPEFFTLMFRLSPGLMQFSRASFDEYFVEKKFKI